MKTEELNTRQRYALYRRQGYSGPEAAERAGYEGRPGPDARELWQAVESEASADASFLHRLAKRMSRRMKAHPDDNPAIRREKLRECEELAEDLLEALSFRREAAAVLAVEERE